MDQAEEHQSTPALRSEDQSTSKRRNFQHSRLNHNKPSIRLIKLHPELSEAEGFVQCKIRHATIKSTYTCLSYVWGAEDRGRWIVLNDELMWVRENLWHFLQEARRKPHIRKGWLWIDALCINQADNAERTHQVGQMGHIYHSAERMISWLGMNRVISEYLAQPPKYEGNAEIWDDFNLCEYWKRAWITQEIVLARQIVFMAGDVEQDEKVLVESRGDRCSATQAHLTPRWCRRQAEGRSLLGLLDWHKDKQCSILRDRVFSLLALCNDASALKADYETPDRELASEILTCCKAELCFCAVNLVIRTLKFRGDLNPKHDIGKSHSIYFANMTLPLVQSPISESERRPIAVLRPFNKTRHVVVDLDLICDQYRGFSIYFNIDSVSEDHHDYAYRAASRFWVTEFPARVCRRYYYAFSDADGRDLGLEFHTSTGVHGCAIELSPSTNSCTISFSLEALLRVAETIRFTGRHCHGQGGRQEQSSVLQLC